MYLSSLPFPALVLSKSNPVYSAKEYGKNGTHSYSEY
jgi:hypothetical protein